MKNIMLLPLLFSAVSIISIEASHRPLAGCESPILRHLSRDEQKILIRQRSQGLLPRSPDSRKNTRESIKANLLKPFKKSSSRSSSPAKTR